MGVALARLFAQTYLIGIAVAMPVGAMGVLCIQRTLASGWRSGLATGSGIATADGLYAAVAALGITSISGVLVAWQTPIRVIGGLALVALGVRALGSRVARGPASTDCEPPRTRHFALYLSAVGLTLTNPTTILAFVAVFVSAGLAAGSTREALAATAGVAAGSLSWWIVLTTGTSLLRHDAGERFTLWLNRVSAAVIAGFGLIALFSAIQR